MFSLAGPDFLAATAPDLMTALRERAPRAGLELRGPSARMYTDLVDGHLDLALAPPPSRPTPGVTSEVLTQLEWVVFARRGHPRTRRWGLRSWLRCEHIQIRTQTRHSPVDQATRASGHERRVAAWLPSFSAAAPLVASSDLILTAPEAVLGPLAARFELQVLRCPIPLEAIELALHHAAAFARDEALLLLQEVVKECHGLSCASA